MFSAVAILDARRYSPTFFEAVVADFGLTTSEKNQGWYDPNFDFRVRRKSNANYPHSDFLRALRAEITADTTRRLFLRFFRPDRLAKEAGKAASSAATAGETESYPLSDLDRFLETRTAQQLDEQTLDFIRNNGLGNSHLTSIAPTPMISLVAGNISGGIEPVFAHSYTRRVLQPDNSLTEEQVMSASMTLWRRMEGDEPPPDHFVAAGTPRTISRCRLPRRPISTAPSPRP